MVFKKAVIKNFSVLFAVSVFTCSQADAQGPQASKLEFRDFVTFRAEVLSKIGSAKNRVWIATDFFSDAEIVSSLFIAQYRKLDISVLLGREKATNILSRLNYLKQVKIPVSLRPKDFYPTHPTIFIIDEQVYTSNARLDSSVKSPRISMGSMDPENLPIFAEKFSAAAKLQNAPSMAPLPQVGRPRQNARYYKANHPQNSSASEYPTKKLPAASSEPLKDQIAPTDKTPIGETPSYRYGSTREKAPEGIPTRLPKTTLRQELERERRRNTPQDEGSSAE